MDIVISEKIRQRYMDAILKPVYGNFVTTNIRWLIDSKYRTTVWLNEFLKDQITNPNPDVLAIALKFNKYPFDQRIIKILKFVYDNVQYKDDIKVYGAMEKWATAAQAWKKKMGDCEDMNGLVYILARLSGMPDTVLFANIGDVKIGNKIGGHFWLVYYDIRRQMFVPIDSCFYPEFEEISKRPPFTPGGNYYKIWYVFNDDAVYKPK